jgi:hypothetical protein
VPRSVTRVSTLRMRLNGRLLERQMPSTGSVSRANLGLKRRISPFPRRCFRRRPVSSGPTAPSRTISFLRNRGEPASTSSCGHREGMAHPTPLPSTLRSLHISPGQPQRHEAKRHSRSQHYRRKGPLHDSVGLRNRELHVADSDPRPRAGGGDRHS